MDKQFLADLKNWLTWYNYHRPMIPNMPMEKKIDFLMKANYGSVKLIAGLTDELIAAETGGVATKHVILPPWMRK